ncbi:DUF4232 domain-containing protein [Streptomyces sp. NPDC002057]|uniref:DUF4232 domain-containing protein n=1 Tax=Streptomyces sp. NPDC002057 TaxID=3154664 RepID=UPI00332A23B6
MRAHKLTFAAALAVAASLSLTACGGDGGTGKGAASAPSATASAAGGADAAGPDQEAGKSSGGKSSGGKGSGGKGSGGKGSGGKSSGGKGSGGKGSGGKGSGGSDGTAKCRTDELEITAMDHTIEGDLDGTVAVRLRNRGSGDCVLSGYAGVDLKTEAGPLSAKRTGEPGTSVTLGSGESVAFGVSYPIDKKGGSGVRVTGLLVTPPNETRTVTLDWPGAATLPVTEGPGSPVKVGPVGSAGQGG